MQHLKITVLSIISMFVMGLTFVGTAQAKWEQCAKGGTATKYTDHQCGTASGAGEWSWQEVSGTEEVRVKGSVRMVDRKTLAGISEIECSGESVGSVGPGQSARVTEIKTSGSQCRAIKVCENVETIEARNLPWQGELYDTEGKVLGHATGTGGELGWRIQCKTLLGSMTDECVVEGGKPESALFENRASGSELLVLSTAQHLRKQKCSQGGAESGEISGIAALLSANGSGLRVR